MIDNFYDIKPLEDWLTEESGLICQNANAFVALNVVPSSFGHALVVSKRVVYKATDLTPEELWGLERAKEVGMEQLRILITRTPDRITELYKRWAGDERLNAKVPCKTRIEIVMKDLEKDGNFGDGQVFENHGSRAGQMVRQYHRQIVPRHRSDLNGAGEALFQYLHR
jgi:diadenosine tetraphosphate (Ap4A) HIT family hydrolase